MDVGGYRTFDTISPRTQYLITERLGLSLGCYDPISCLGKVIVDAQGSRIGYATFLEAMLADIKTAGVRVFLNHPMKAMDHANSISRVHLSNLPFPVVANRVVLTLPQYPLQKVRAPRDPYGYFDGAPLTLSTRVAEVGGRQGQA